MIYNENYVSIKISIKNKVTYMDDDMDIFQHFF